MGARSLRYGVFKSSSSGAAYFQNGSKILLTFKGRLNIGFPSSPKVVF